MCSLQVYTSQRAEYKGGKFFGHEQGVPTRTLLSFLISSLGGQYEDLVCFVPTVTLNAQSLFQHFQAVLKSLMSIGFFVAVILVDGHRINMKFFADLGNGSLEICIQNPLQAHSKLFLMFDPVHLYKNFYHNFERQR